ncbi:MAG: hypothetical protein GC149_06190 [Gammaproteobacteria bacterium]|nr:hypothetical protein [Gammaproteobacteria bacterium]
MGLLDDLKQQAQKQQGATGGETQPGGTEEFYRDHVKSRMVATFNFFNDLINQLNSMNLETRADYPFRPDGKSVTLLQQGYKVFSDEIPNPRQITLACFGGLVNPVVYEVQGRSAVLAQSELLDRYNFKYEKREQKDARQMVTGAKFRLVGPLQLKISLQYDESRQVIKLLVSNFSGAGTSQYHLRPEQLDEAFRDLLGRYLLRKVDSLFREEISEEDRKKIRDRMIVEARIREQELLEAEARRNAEKAAEKERTAKEQIKRAVNTQKEQLKRVMNSQVAKGKESLKGMFDKLKKQVQASEQTPSVQPTLSPASAPPTKPAQAPQQVTAKTVMPAQTNTPTTVTTPVTAGVAAQAREPAAPLKTATPKKPTQPPKVYNAPPNNPFLKPEPPEEPPLDTTERDAMLAAETPAPAKPAIENPATAEPSATKSELELVPLTETPARADIAPAPEPDTTERDAQSPAETTQPPAKPVIDKPATAEPSAAKSELELVPMTATPARADIAPAPEPDTTERDAMSPAQTTPAPVKAAIDKPATAEPSAAKSEPVLVPVTATSARADMAPALELDTAERDAMLPAETPPPAKPAIENPATKKPSVAKSEPAPVPTTDASTRPDLTPESLAEDLARIIERDKQNVSQQTTQSKNASNPFLQTSSAKVTAQTATTPAAMQRPRPYLKPGELNTGLTGVLPKSRQAVSAKDATSPEAKNSTQNPFLKPDEMELDIDISGNVVPPQRNDSEENS